MTDITPAAPTASAAPDDTEVDQAILEAEDLIEALWELGEKYNIPLTNNLPRWQDGVYLREVGEFIGDVRAIMALFPDQAAPFTPEQA